MLAKPAEEHRGHGAGYLLGVDRFTEQNEVVAAGPQRAEADGGNDLAHDGILLKMAAGGGPVGGIHIGIGARRMDRSMGKALQSLSRLNLKELACVRR
jgi:hypothetical protein